ncbi:MAG: TIGR03745 family integrating conjugative element membrane protein [Candidatus Thiodiazotropha sp.]|jgi:integrating conjugative element membrane protein (TIGR03745 family)
MKQMIVTYKDKLITMKMALVSLMLFAASSAHASLPTTAAPSHAAGAGDYIALLKGYAYDIAIVLGLILATIAFLSVGKNMIAVYNDIGAGKKTWGDMGMHGGMGVLLLVFVVYLLTESATIIFT